ncbi:hypothetical protein H2198_002125 [Neophaeococcomyces mojaviensis]|uniref:Uncharacterized protein n=1 Tax=Neophaeococcomyces mojaviensis TaxID=3383035 RepID=A0ACC3AF64_9EURO|nr:hypothetical protein H2198_002125 [Knufia sp. JES_112]
MASLSLPSPAASFDVFTSSGPPRHMRKHSRNPTAAAPLPSFTFNPGAPTDENKTEGNEDGAAQADMVGAGHMRKPSEPVPLPEFKFNPGADIPLERAPSLTHPVLKEMALNQQRVSRSARPAPLPVFTFNPDATPGQMSTSPTKSDVEVDGTKTGGHRRGGSEFVGGGLDKPKLVVASPSKHEAKPSGPPIAASAGRGHSHRRSQAISISDIDTSELIKQHALAKARAPSTPSTPIENQFSFPRASPGQRFTIPSASRSPPASPRRRGSASGVRPRTVDFSERVDVIPRPLSMISSETERSNSTIRGHSVTNSISSIVSPLPVSPVESSAPTSPPLSTSTNTRRPNTADATLLLSNVNQKNNESLLTIPKRPLSACGSPMVSSSGSPPTKKKHFWYSPGNDLSPTPTPKQEQANPFEEKDFMTPVADPDRVRPKTAPERPSSHKRRKYHTWTAGIFSKKSKHRASKGKSRRSPTPPTLLRRDSDKVNEIFDADDTVVLRQDSPVGTRKQPQAVTTLPTPTATSFHAELTSPVIDLDTALDPYDGLRHSEDHARSTTSKIAKLHSSERRGVVDAFGISHRRTESAPTMSPVNRSALFGMQRHGSNASLSEDVFDEEEEDNFLAHENEIKSSCVSNKVATQETTINPESGLGLENVPSHVDDVIIVDPETDTGAEDMRSSKSTIEAPAFAVEDLPKRPATSPMSFAYPNPQSHYASSTEGRTTSASLISSPDAEHLSFDTQSRTRRLCELSTEYIQPSTDDLPSLSDSVSSSVPRVSGSGNTRPSLDQRSHSMFVPGSSKPYEGWKRSSLASLNRLIPGSSHGSKLKFEAVATPNEETTKKKSNRISKLMRFWRSKEAGDREGHTL